jgi:hypothetical protein
LPRRGSRVQIPFPAPILNLLLKVPSFSRASQWGLLPYFSVGVLSSTGRADHRRMNDVISIGPSKRGRSYSAWHCALHLLSSRQLEALSGERIFPRFSPNVRLPAYRRLQISRRIPCDCPVKVFAAVSHICAGLLGNHGQGFALACRLQRVTVHVVMAKAFSAMKHRAVLRSGTQVHEFENRSST